MSAIVAPHGGVAPRFGERVFLAPTAVVIGDVELGDRVSIWYGAVLRGDVHSIRVGADSNVQDGAVLHGTLGEFPVLVGARVSIGHQATVHGAIVEDDCLIGIGARILDGARVGAGSLVAAGAIVREGMQIPPRSLVVGVPAVVKRELTEREVELIRRTPPRYAKLASDARSALLASSHSDPSPSPTRDA
ncbi:MAG: gamma carbonic anhydrase family protein [Planctomycetes bacterium]|nr:gamma carbonic anhydrase family protein [Planctomycetota bacterium]